MLLVFNDFQSTVNEKTNCVNNIFNNIKILIN